MTRREVDAYNAGVMDVLKIARRAALAIQSTTTRRNHEDFAVAALTELHGAGRALVIPTEGQGK